MPPPGSALLGDLPSSPFPAPALSADSHAVVLNSHKTVDGRSWVNVGFISKACTLLVFVCLLFVVCLCCMCPASGSVILYTLRAKQRPANTQYICEGPVIFEVNV